MSYFTTHETFFVIPLSQCDEEMQKIDHFLILLEKSGVGDVIKNTKYRSSPKGRKSYNPYNLFASILFLYSKRITSVRDMAEAFMCDLRLIYIMQQECPSYKTINDFIKNVITPNRDRIFSLITETIIKEFKLNIDDQYLDGTKFEANANKYKFVYISEKRMDSLNDKIIELYKAMNITEYDVKQRIKSVDFNTNILSYAKENKVDILNIPKGKGKRCTKAQRLVKKGFEYLSKLLEYEENSRICGDNRKSFYKTEHDATAMCLKSDYYSKLGTNTHAAYNIQILVSAGLITMYGVYQDRTDYHTLPNIMERYHENYENYPLNLCADAGYGTYSNYCYLNEKKINNYVKFQNWQGEASGKNPQRYFFEDSDSVKCLNGLEGQIIPYGKAHQRCKGANLYRFEGCLNCKHENTCRKKRKNRDTNYLDVELNPKYEQYKKQARENLQSVLGIEIRVNRSIQVEGSFGNIKQNYGFVRLKRKGLNNVACEIMMICLAVNIRKFFTLYMHPDKAKSKYWKAPEGTKPEEFPNKNKNK